MINSALIFFSASEHFFRDKKRINQRKAEKDAYFNSKPCTGRPPDFDKRIKQAKAKETEARRLLDIAQDHQERGKEAICEIGKGYHPYDLETGVPRSAEEVSSALNQWFSEIEEVALEAHLGNGLTEYLLFMVVPNIPLSPPRKAEPIGR